MPNYRLKAEGAHFGSARPSVPPEEKPQEAEPASDPGTTQTPEPPVAKGAAQESSDA